MSGPLLKVLLYSHFSTYSQGNDHTYTAENIYIYIYISEIQNSGQYSRSSLYDMSQANTLKRRTICAQPSIQIYIQTLG